MLNLLRAEGRCEEEHRGGRVREKKCRWTQNLNYLEGKEIGRLQKKMKKNYLELKFGRISWQYDF
jgi:nucleoside-specific outer membrane channel protein Tsx